jgi:2'-5' RNA ligase
MRLFVGTLLSRSNQDFYDRFIQDLVHRHRESLRGIPERTAHLTYAFCAEANDQGVEAILAALKQTAAAHHPFEIALAAPHVVSAGRQPRLVCADICRGEGPLRRLTDDLLARLQRTCPDLPVTPSRTPHVTLARFRKQAKRSDAQAVSHSLTGGQRPALSTSDEIEHLHLVSSTLTPGGPVYEIRAQVRLA